MPVEHRGFAVFCCACHSLHYAGMPGSHILQVFAVGDLEGSGCSCRRGHSPPEVFPFGWQRFRASGCRSRVSFFLPHVFFSLDARLFVPEPRCGGCFALPGCRSALPRDFSSSNVSCAVTRSPPPSDACAQVCEAAVMTASPPEFSQHLRCGQKGEVHVTLLGSASAKNLRVCERFSRETRRLLDLKMAQDQQSSTAQGNLPLSHPVVDIARHSTRDPRILF